MLAQIPKIGSNGPMTNRSKVSYILWFNYEPNNFVFDINVTLDLEYTCPDG